MKHDRSMAAGHSCDEHLQLIEREGRYPIHGVSVPVREELYRCGVCGEEQFSFEQMQAVEREAARVYREQEGYLQPEEIRALRERWGLTQAQLEEALGLGKKTVVRWEAGRVLQQRAMDNLLRVMERFPQVLAFLAVNHDVRVSEAIGHIGESGEEALRLPRSLRQRLSEAAASEGTDVNTLAVSILSQGVERRSLSREMERINQKLDRLDGAFNPWSGAPVIEEDESWYREHKQIRRETHAKAIAI
jgi:putative zinc finger/helix-turn-helix YgiT family protein